MLWRCIKWGAQIRLDIQDWCSLEEVAPCDVQSNRASARQIPPFTSVTADGLFWRVLTSIPTTSSYYT